MSSHWETTPFAAFLTPVRRRPVIDPDKTYKMVTLPLYGKGARLRKECLGAELGTSKFEVRTGDLMISKIDARKGSNSLLPPELDGAIVTGDFLSYTVDESVILKTFFDIIVRSPVFAGLCDTISAGSTNRVRLETSRFLDLTIELPPLEEQQRIVDLTDCMDCAIEAADESTAAAEHAYSEVRRELLSGNTRLGGFTDPLEVSRLDDLAEVIMGQSPPGSSYNRGGIGIPFIQGSAEFGDVSPTPVQWCTDPRKIAEPGDLLVSVRAPVGDMNVASDRVAIGRGLSILRSHEGVAQEYLALAVENSANQLASVSAGSTFASITKESLRGIEVALHSEDEQKLIVETLTPLRSTARSAQDLAGSLRATRSELLTVLLSGEHEIPETYGTDAAPHLEPAA